jgi:hypothetical protein
MAEMSMAGKDHFHVMLIAIVDGFFVFYRSSRLDDALDSRLMGFLYAIGNRIKKHCKSFVGQVQTYQMHSKG